MLLNMNQIRQLFGVSRVTIYEWERVGRIPKRLNVYGGPRWDKDETLKRFAEYQPKGKGVQIRKIA